jgi:hypothetical protein
LELGNWYNQQDRPEAAGHTGSDRAVAVSRTHNLVEVGVKLFGRLDLLSDLSAMAATADTYADVLTGRTVTAE